MMTIVASLALLAATAKGVRAPVATSASRSVAVAPTTPMTAVSPATV